MVTILAIPTATLSSCNPIDPSVACPTGDCNTQGSNQGNTYGSCPIVCVGYSRTVTLTARPTAAMGNGAMFITSDGIESVATFNGSVNNLLDAQYYWDNGCRQISIWASGRNPNPNNPNDQGSFTYIVGGSVCQ